MPHDSHRTVYLCWLNGWSLQNVGLALVDARPTPPDAVCLAHTSVY